ncbi:MAG: hypothetical protein HYU55_15405, partial [Nocardioides sp.]|nr:hypothetical protein [Nocardioides sp.]
MADHRHKRANARRSPRAAFVAAPLAVLATASAVTFGVLATSPEARDLVAQEATADLGTPADRPAALSRAGSRVDAAEKRAEERAEELDRMRAA